MQSGGGFRRFMMVAVSIVLIAASVIAVVLVFNDYRTASAFSRDTVPISTRLVRELTFQNK